MAQPLSRISINPNVCFGKPCIKGTRIWASLILDLLAGGETEAEIVADYPQLQVADIRAAAAMGSALAALDRIILDGPRPPIDHGIRPREVS